MGRNFRIQQALVEDLEPAMRITQNSRPAERTWVEVGQQALSWGDTTARSASTNNLELELRLRPFKHHCGTCVTTMIDVLDPVSDGVESNLYPALVQWPCASIPRCMIANYYVFVMPQDAQSV
jgi:hypothetical protein